MKVEAVNITNLDEFIKNLFSLQLSGKYVFRGYCKDDELKPALVRNFDKLELKDIKMQKYERFLLEQYSKYSIQYLPPYECSLDWVSSAQHYGIPTRLIDWTFDPFVALYFATFFNQKIKENCFKLIVASLEENIYFDHVPNFPSKAEVKVSSNHAHIDNYFVFVDALEKQNHCFDVTYRDPTISGFCKNLKKSFELETETITHKLFFCSLNQSTSRVIAQRGLFQIPRRFFIHNNQKDQTEECVANDIINGSEIIYEIDKELWPQIAKILEKLGIRTPQLFPDLASISEYIKRMKP